jgi:putative flippase GtrA
LPRAAWGELADIEGDRYEYEMNMLLRLRDINCPLVQIPIRTIYLNQNKGSHFNAVRDAMRIYSVILRFAASSLASFAADYLIYLILLGAGWAVWGAYALARVLSGSMNFYLNRNWVFHKRGGWGAIARYAALWAAQLAVGAWLSHIFSDGNARIGRWIKLPIDSILFLLSYLAQRELVFNNRFMNDKK